MANYLIAVGGTGQHVALAVADFLALAHEIYPTPDAFPGVHLILVDADQAADNDQPSAWQEAHSRLNGLGLLGGDSFECVPLPVGSRYSDTRRMYEFLNRLGSSFGPSAADALLLAEQRDVDITTGFYAQPRVGAMMAEWLFEQVRLGENVNPALARIFRLAGDPANRIVVAGSGVGGTGAGFAPALVRQLSLQNGGARLMALMATEWFRLSGACSNRLSEAVQKTNANSALWHAASNDGNAHVRTTLFGHRHVSRAAEEPCQNGAFQARKTNLTIPYYAAAATTSFFSGDTSAGTHVPAAVYSGDLVTLASSLRVTPQLTLRNLIESNVDAVGRLTLAVEYLRERYHGHVLPFAALSGRVAALDTADVKVLEASLRAKRAALVNLRGSDARLAAAPRYYPGIETLRSWTNGEVHRPSDLWKQVPLASRATQTEEPLANGDTAALLIRKLEFAGRVTGGAIVPISAAQVRELVSVDDVDVSKVPASDAAALTLGKVFESWSSLLAEQRKAIADLIVDGSNIRKPFLVSGDSGDRPREWLKRWALLINLLAEGKLTIEEKTLPFTNGKVLSFGKTPVGELSADFVCLPLINGHWNSEETVSKMWAAASRMETLATWCETTETVARCRSQRSPVWVEMLRFATSRLATSAKQFSTQSVTVEWPDVGSVSLPLPNATARDADAKDCVEATARAFAVLVQQPSPDEMSPNVRDVVREIDRNAWSVPTLNSSETRKLVFAELLSSKARECLFGEVIIDVAKGMCWKLDATHVPSLAGALLTKNIGCFRNDQRTKWLTPLRREYLSLLRSGAIAIRTEEHGPEVRVSLTVGGRTFVESYSASRVRAINPLLLHWPSSVASSSSTLAVLFDVQERRYNAQAVYVVMHDGEAKQWSLSPLLNERHSLHYVVTGSNVPYALSFELEHEDVGFVSVERTLQDLTDSEQKVAVDFGTSATVVAARSANGTVVLDLLAPRADATAEVWRGADLTAFQWYGTRSLDGNVTKKRRAPSALVYLGSANEARPPQPRFGDHILLDQDDWQWKNGETSLLFDIKWTRESAYREAYLTHHLEQCLAVALRQNIVSSRQLSMTFTLPLRQRARADDFCSEVERVTGVLQQRTGIAIWPRFAYESEVIVPKETPRGDVDAMVVADLGGGTLDLFARDYGSKREKNTSADVFESARIGGHALVEWLTRNFDGAQLAEYRRRIRVGLTAQLDDESARMATAYFDVVKRFIALWMDSVWRYWHGEGQPGNVHVQLLGMGWSLPGSPGDQMAPHLSDIAAAVGSSLTYSRFEERVLPDNPKELLALRTLDHVGKLRNEFVGFEPASVNGIEVNVAGQVRGDQEAMTVLGANIPNVSITPRGLDRIQKLTGAHEEIVARVRDGARVTLTTCSTGVGKDDGAVLDGRNTWVASPLAVAAETYARKVLLQVNR